MIGNPLNKNGVRGGSCFSQNENYPVRNKNCSIRDENYFIRDENYFIRDENYFIRDENYFIRDENYFIRDENYFIRDENYFIRDENYFIRDENYFIRDENYFIRDENYFIRDENYFIRDENYFIQINGFQNGDNVLKAVWHLEESRGVDILAGQLHVAACKEEKYRVALIQFARTIAHELGHGAFLLRHTFPPSAYNIENGEGNLMGYNDSTHLAKFQWDEIHNGKAGSKEFESAPLNGCYRIAHLLAQVNHESNGMKATKEFLEYSLQLLLDNFNTTSSAKMFFKQSFWDDKEYLQYAVKDIYEMVDTTKSETGDYDAVGYETYRYNNSSTDTIRIPVLFTLNKGKGLYKKVTLTADEEQANKERWVNQVYGRSSLGNGGPETGDGYRYRGRGAIQLTGKDNYRRVGEKCNQLFGTSYDWVNNPDMVANDLQANIYAAIGYILIAFPDLSLLDGTDVSAVTLKINSKGLGLSERKAKFDALIQTKYKCQ
jgi:predicted chitinase